MMISEFLSTEEHQNSKTYYYLRLISEHPYGLLVENEDVKNNLIQQYKELNRGYKIISIYNVNNEFDVSIVKTRYFSGSLNGLIDDVGKDDSHSELQEFNILTQDKIREIILTDMALGEYDY